MIWSGGFRWRGEKNNHENTKVRKHEINLSCFHDNRFFSIQGYTNKAKYLGLY